MVLDCPVKPDNDDFKVFTYRSNNYTSLRDYVKIKPNSAHTLNCLLYLEPVFKVKICHPPPLVASGAALGG